MTFFSPVKRQLKRRIGPPLQMLGYKTGIMQMTARMMKIEGAVALMYHSVAEDAYIHWIDPSNHVPSDVFEEQMKILAWKKNVVRLSELIAILRQGVTPKTRTVTITFDDGYIDNLTVAAPILNRYGLSATLFLPTNYIERGETQWIDQVYTAFEFRTKNELTWGDDTNLFYDLGIRERYTAGYRSVCNSLIEATGAKRRVLINKLIECLKPSRTPPRLTMNWEEIKTLLKKHSCFEIGGHSLEHTDLTSVNLEEARRELEDCALRIEEKLGIRPKYFSFCYGRTSRQLRELVAQTGYESAFGGDGADPIINASTNLYALPRVEAPRTARGFELTICSANTGLWRRLGR